MPRLYIIVVAFGCFFLAHPVDAQQRATTQGGTTRSGQAQQMPVRQQQQQQQQPIRQQAAGPQQSIARTNGQAPGAPEWLPLDPQHEEHLNKILKFWEWQTAKIERYRCQFVRWEYDPIKLPRDPQTAATISEGDIQYQAPDKGLFQVTKLWDVAMTTEPGQQSPQVALKDGRPQYVPRKDPDTKEWLVDEHWVCDGKSIFEIDRRNKQIKQRELPPDMQGKNIAEGPLPFLFGAKVETMKQQYWIRVLPHDPNVHKPGKFYLEAIPKQQPQAADFKAIHIVIDEQEFLPDALILYFRNNGRETFEFKNRETNWTILPDLLGPWRSQFYAPKVPQGWKLVQEPLQNAPQQEVPPTANRAPAAPGRQATRAPGAEMKR